jgi:uncharacterized protein YceK
MKPILLAVIVALTLAGCATAPAAKPTPTNQAFTYGSSATAIASAVKACKDVHEQSVSSTAVGIASMAACTIGGKQVDFYSWKDATAQGDPSAMFAGLGAEIYYASAEGWAAVAHEDGDLPGQQSVSTAVVASLNGNVIHSKP